MSIGLWLFLGLWGDHGRHVEFLDRPGQHFLGRNGRLLPSGRFNARTRARHELPRPGAGGDDEFESVGHLAGIGHWNVPTIDCAWAVMRDNRDREDNTMLRSRSTAAVSSSLTTTNWYSVK